MKYSIKRKLTGIFSVVVALMMAASLTGCSSSLSRYIEKSQAAAEAQQASENQVEFTFEVVEANGDVTTFSISTDKKTVGEALLAEGLIAGEESEYGLYVKQVNGITADYDVDQTYWAFYIDGEYATTGVDSTKVVAGSTYSFKVEK